MKIFYYSWNENSGQDLAESLQRCGHDVLKCQMPFSDYEEDSAFAGQLERIFKEQDCDIFFSFDFFPLIAKTAEKLKKYYLSWVYDTPHFPLFSDSIKSGYVKLFLFDREQCARIKSRKKEGVYHVPLAVNIPKLDRVLGRREERPAYRDEISFVGSLYEQNQYRKIRFLPDSLRGYFEGIMAAQQKITGYNFVEELLNEKTMRDLETYVKFGLNETYAVSSSCIFSAMLNAEITARERREMLETAALAGTVSLYSGQKTAEIPHLLQKGPVSYDTEMPQVFYHSKINLNATLRSITSGIPLRALDIMGAGGFLLSNYQPELAEYFEDGKEMVLYDGRNDLLDKLQYYLAHDSEREEIAYNGRKKIEKEYSYEVLLKRIWELSGL